MCKNYQCSYCLFNLTLLMLSRKFRNKILVLHCLRYPHSVIPQKKDISKTLQVHPCLSAPSPSVPIRLCRPESDCSPVVSQQGPLNGVLRQSGLYYSRTRREEERRKSRFSLSFTFIHQQNKSSSPLIIFFFTLSRVQSYVSKPNFTIEEFKNSRTRRQRIYQFTFESRDTLKPFSLFISITESESGTGLKHLK